MLMAMMVVSMGTTVSAAETQDRGAELIQMEEEAQELDGFTGQAYVDLNTLGVNTQTVNPGRNPLRWDAQHPMHRLAYGVLKRFRCLTAIMRIPIYGIQR